jgi:hypothetical protein
LTGKKSLPIVSAKGDRNFLVGIDHVENHGVWICERMGQSTSPCDPSVKPLMATQE